MTEQKTVTTPEQLQWFEELGQLVSCEGEDACYLSDDALDVIRRIQNATLERAAKSHDMEAFSAKSSAKADPRASDDIYADAERHEEYAEAIRALKEPS